MDGTIKEAMPLGMNPNPGFDDRDNQSRHGKKRCEGKWMHDGAFRAGTTREYW